MRTFCSKDGKREAHVVMHATGLWVDLFERNEQEKLEQRHKIDVSDHSIHYAEDTAENWVTYVIRD